MGTVSVLYGEKIGEKEDRQSGSDFLMLMRLTPLLQEEARVVPDDPPCNLGGDVHGDF